MLTICKPLFAFSSRRIKLNLENRISKGWKYLLKETKAEHPLEEMRKYDTI
jgi:hypothetical protein